MIFFRGKTILPFYFWLFFVCLLVQVTMNDIILRLVCMNVLTSDGLSIIKCFCKYLFDDDYCVIFMILINENPVEVMLGLKCDIIHTNMNPYMYFILTCKCMLQCLILILQKKCSVLL